MPDGFMNQNEMYVYAVNSPFICESIARKLHLSSEVDKSFLEVTKICFSI